jgi:hypothetical protein
VLSFRATVSIYSHRLIVTTTYGWIALTCNLDSCHCAGRAHSGSISQGYDPVDSRRVEKSGVLLMCMLVLLLFMYVCESWQSQSRYIRSGERIFQIFFFPPVTPPSLFFFSFSCKVYGSLRGLGWYEQASGFRLLFGGTARSRSRCDLFCSDAAVCGFQD